MPTGIPGSGRGKAAKAIAVAADPEIGRRQCFSLAVKHGLTRADLDQVAEQLEQVGRLVDLWHAAEVEIMTKALSVRDGESLAELADKVSAEAWQQVADAFESHVHGYRAVLIKGQVQVQEA